MTGPSSAPRGEHTPAPGVTWQPRLARAEQLVDDDTPDPRANRATRRAFARAARRKK
ncbi:hypothetical protein [Streptomyces anatolicus]|uniref:hypothetical protein n=1 Tax=Streptomyces anatolicus TaxID=2675858 RepID=UPI001CA554DD|nr:hypothetical protein [Streptomyces anatolicus]